MPEPTTVVAANHNSCHSKPRQRYCGRRADYGSHRTANLRTTLQIIVQQCLIQANRLKPTTKYYFRLPWGYRAEWGGRTTMGPSTIQRLQKGCREPERIQQQSMRTTRAVGRIDSMRPTVQHTPITLQQTIITRLMFRECWSYRYGRR